MEFAPLYCARTDLRLVTFSRRREPSANHRSAAPHSPHEPAPLGRRVARIFHGEPLFGQTEPSEALGKGSGVLRLLTRGPLTNIKVVCSLRDLLNSASLSSAKRFHALLTGTMAPELSTMAVCSGSSSKETPCSSPRADA